MKWVEMRDDGDDGGVEFQQGCLSGSWNAGSATVREFWKGGRRKEAKTAGLFDRCVYICLGMRRGGREKEGFYLARQSLRLGLCLSLGRLSSPLVWERSGGVQREIDKDVAIWRGAVRLDSERAGTVMQ